MGAPTTRPTTASGRSVRIPRQARSRRTRERVLESAVDCFERCGYDETTTAMIAERAGIAVGTLYGYFADKRDILLELLEGTVVELANHVIDELGAAVEDDTDPRESARSLIDAVFHTQKLRPGMQRIMWERYFKDEAFREPVESIRTGIRDAIDGFVAALEPRGVLRAFDRRTASYVVLNAVQWNATHAFIQGDAHAIDRAAAATAEMISRYLFVDAPSTPASASP